MTKDEDPYDNRKPVPGSVPSSVRKAGDEARIAEKKASDEWVHVDEIGVALASVLKDSHKYDPVFRLGLEHGAEEMWRRLVYDQESG